MATIADFASGSARGHKEALPGRPCRGDVFHALYDVGPLVRYLENRACTKPSIPEPSWSESEPLPSGGMAGRTQSLADAAIARTAGRGQGDRVG